MNDLTRSWSPGEAVPLGERIKGARVQHRAGAGTVLDVLMREPGATLEKLRQEFLDWCGIEVIGAATGWMPDFSSWPMALAQQTQCVVVVCANTHLLAMADPLNADATRRVAQALGRQLCPAAASAEALSIWLGTGGGEALPLEPSIPAGEGPVVAFVDAALAGAFSAGASDVHFESDRVGIGVKLRLDGVMNRFARLEGSQLAQEVISRIKVLAQLDITERRLPQDGRFRHRFEGNELDLRVSIMPSIHGEDAVLRLLDKAQLRSQHTTTTLDALGFGAGDAQLIRSLCREPSGMLLVTGPTGSGKTTTVYAALSEINDGLEKIITIEDPVEYELAGVLQIPVNERKGLTFAQGLRSILRHDPDRILVGEIRDAETAEIAVQSALTGHLVFTTVHANNVADIMGRFRHFGLDMFGFMSSLNGVVVQRLMRCVCPQCVEARDASEAELRWLTDHSVTGMKRVPRARGCPACRGTGYSGRFVVCEVHVVDDVLRDQVTEGAPLSELRQHGQKRGVASLATQAASRVAQGSTTLEEVKRVVGWL